MKLSVVKLNLIEYQAALDLQLEILKLRKQDVIGDVLLLLEHPPVLTIGVNGKNKNNILVSKEFLRATGVQVCNCNRGGDVTYHGPGQIVGYPILNLIRLGKDFVDYVRRLEEVFIRLLNEQYGISAARSPGFPGVWVGDEKIIALGCAIKRWVTMHGFAFNVNTNLEHFRWIKPCGFTDKGVTSLQKIQGSPQDMEKVMSLIVDYFSAVFLLEPEIVERTVFLEYIKELSYEYT